MNDKSFLYRFLHHSREVKLIMLATLITNMGNGMFTIAISKLVYDRTNSALAFGGVLILQYLVMLSVQLLSGSLVDRNNPKFVSVICDVLSGFLVLSSGLVVLITNNLGLVYLFIAVILLNIVSPFFSSANFALLPAIVKDESQLLEINSMITTLFQGGQLLGCALVAPIIYLFNTPTALIIDGITFFLSALFVSFAKVIHVRVKKDVGKNIGINLINDWKEIARAMKKEKSFAAHLFMASGDYLSIVFFNLMLVPMVTHWYKNNSFYISLYDGGFAVGAMIFVTFVVLLSKKLGINNSAFLGLLVQSLLFIFLILSRNPLITFLIMLTFGAANAFSVAIFTSHLQQRCTGPIKGRVGSMKNLIVSCLSIVLIPLISKLLDASIVYGLSVSFGIIFSYSLISFIFGRKVSFGDDYLSKPIKIDKYQKRNADLDLVN
ncbi:MFS transporter [Sporolactobacillus pectinivorans]|uniref:MFS transporter n=1 Tax=Sporolactobacillus pectinivorans TaxID=1591408 RepID=UPI0012FD52C6|nr:MFS transporter [Sporolactobacillus pectinivorans]